MTEQETIRDLRAHILEMRDTMRWMVALIDGREQMPHPGDDIYEAMNLCIINTKYLAEHIDA